MTANNVTIGIDLFVARSILPGTQSSHPSLCSGLRHLLRRRAAL